MKHTLILAAIVCAASLSASAAPDSIAPAFSRPLHWRAGVEIAPAAVIGTNSFLKGDNREDRRIGTSLSGALRCDFSFDSSTREGMLYRGLYQGVGADVRSFFAGSLLGTPASVYVYQGAPIARLGGRLWLGYEWRFGAAFGWKHYEEETAEDNAAVSTSVTAHMGASLKLHYALTDHWQLTAAVDATHFSNGNTSWPNKGVNSVGLSIGAAYVFDPQAYPAEVPAELTEEADRGRWFFDITAYGAWRKRTIMLGDEACLLQGKFGVAGLQFAPMRSFNRWFAAGASLDLQYDESAGLEPYWAGGFGDQQKFVRPPFGKQLSAGISAHAELTMPIFAVNAGVGIELLSPKGNRRFYQTLTLKTFITRNLYLNTGYSLGNFKDPRNLMLGLGVRL